MLSEEACRSVLRDPWWLEAPSSKLLNKFHNAATLLIGSDREDDEPSLLRSIYGQVEELRKNMVKQFKGEFPLPPLAPELRWKSEQEEKEDEEARWMAGEVSDPQRASQETRLTSLLTLVFSITYINLSITLFKTYITY